MLEYLHDKVCEELDGACEYIRMAIEHKGTKKEWSNKMFAAAKQELEHAEMFWQFYSDTYKEIVSAYPENNIPPYLSEDMDKLMKKYEEKYPKVKYLMEFYAK